MSRVLFNPDKIDMMAISVKYNGNIAKISEHFNVSRETIYKYIKRDPEGKEIIESTRGINTETDLDAAEHVIRYNMMNYKNNPGLAQRAAEKVIDRKGHLRDWNNPTNPLPPNDGSITDLLTWIKGRNAT